MADAVGYFFRLDIIVRQSDLYRRKKIRSGGPRTDENAKCIFYAECFTLRS